MSKFRGDDAASSSPQERHAFHAALGNRDEIGTSGDTDQAGIVHMDL